jgi:hypothetical protein
MVHYYGPNFYFWFFCWQAKKENYIPFLLKNEIISKAP